MSSDWPFGAVGASGEGGGPKSQGVGGGVGVRVVLVPDLAGGPLLVLSVLEALLADLAAWEAGDAADPPVSRPALTLPVPLAHGGAVGAVRRLAAGLGPTQCLGSGRGRLLGPDGCAHMPLSVLTVRVGDIDVLAATAGALGPPGAGSGRGGRAAGLRRSPARSVRWLGGSGTGLVPAVAGLAGLLDLAPTGDTQLLVARLAANPVHLDLALSDAEEAAYTATVGRFAALWSAGYAPAAGRPLY